MTKKPKSNPARVAAEAGLLKSLSEITNGGTLPVLMSRRVFVLSSKTLEIRKPRKRYPSKAARLHATLKAWGTTYEEHTALVRPFWPVEYKHRYDELLAIDAWLRAEYGDPAICGNLLRAGGVMAGTKSIAEFRKELEGGK